MSVGVDRPLAAGPNDRLARVRRLGLTSTDPLTFGAAGFHQGLFGLLDDIRLYNRALSDQEIEQLANPK